MSASDTSQLSGLLQFEVDGQVFAILVADLAGVRQMSEISQGDAADTLPSNFRTHAFPVDLSLMFFGYTATAESRSVLVAQASGRLCPLVVDRVLPGTVDPLLERHAMPEPLASLGLPFSGMFFKSDQWVVILDTSRLIDQVASLSPESIVEAAYERVS